MRAWRTGKDLCSHALGGGTVSATEGGGARGAAANEPGHVPAAVWCALWRGAPSCHDLVAGKPVVAGAAANDEVCDGLSSRLGERGRSRTGDSRHGPDAFTGSKVATCLASDAACACGLLHARPA